MTALVSVLVLLLSLTYAPGSLGQPNCSSLDVFSSTGRPTAASGKLRRDSALACCDTTNHWVAYPLLSTLCLWWVWLLLQGPISRSVDELDLSVAPPRSSTRGKSTSSMTDYGRDSGKSWRPLQRITRVPSTPWGAVSNPLRSIKLSQLFEQLHVRL